MKPPGHGVNSIDAETKRQLKNETKLHCNKLRCKLRLVTVTGGGGGGRGETLRGFGTTVMLIES